MNESGHRHGWLLIAVASLTITLVLRAGGVLQRPEWTIGDLYARWLRHEVASDIVIIGIDEHSIAQLHKWPWRRSVHARLLDRLRLAHPRHLFLDIDFSAESDPQEDAQLSQALAQWRPGSLILPAFQQVASEDKDEIQLTQPLPAFRMHATLGCVNVLPRGDSVIRDVDSTWAVPGTQRLRGPSRCLRIARCPAASWPLITRFLRLRFSFSPTLMCCKGKCRSPR